MPGALEQALAGMAVDADDPMPVVGAACGAVFRSLHGVYGALIHLDKYLEVAMAHQILSETAASITELKRNPMGGEALKCLRCV
jgi:hypothetical protein